MIVYCLDAPLDFWSGWQKPSDVFKVLDGEGGRATDPVHDAGEWYPLWHKAQELAERAGWEGDIREGPFVTVVPGDFGELSPVIIAWKQGNNGVTFIASPFELPWYESDPTMTRERG